jgi:hypothetical protein
LSDVFLAGSTLRAIVSRTSVAAVLAVLVTLLFCSVALADGDPASDVLLGESVFYPFTPTVSASLQKKLGEETAAASRAHFPIKVALIGSPVDLGAIPSLFGKPQQYANFLDQEISFGSQKDPLLVVMRAGYGVSGLDRAATVAVATLHKPAGASVDDLAQAAVLAVPRLAGAAGHPIAAAAVGTPSSGSSSLLPVVLLVVVAVAAAVAITAVRRRRTRGSVR